MTTIVNVSDLVSIAAYAKEVGISRQAVYKQIAKNQVSFIKTGSTYLIRRKAH